MQQLKNELKNTFTSYWEYLALRAACQLNLFDEIDKGNNTINTLVKKLQVDTNVFKTLISALIDCNVIVLNKKEISLTEKGKMLTDKHADSMKQACILWGTEHLSAWQNLLYTINTGKPSFNKLYGTSFFDYIKLEDKKLYNYHHAMAEYAKDDYKNITKIIDFSKFETITDVGGGLGTLVQYISEKHPNKKYNLFELSEVIDLIDKKSNINYIKGNFFKLFQFKSEIIILSRVLHDWNDEKATIILKNCFNSLASNGKLIVVEIMQDKMKAYLLSLNMALMTKSYERTYIQYKKLLTNTNFTIKEQKELNDLQTILIVQKEHEL